MNKHPFPPQSYSGFRGSEHWERMGASFSEYISTWKIKTALKVAEQLRRDNQRNHRQHLTILGETLKPGWHLRIIETGYLIHDYEEDKDYAFKNIKELEKWLTKLDKAIEMKNKYEEYKNNLKADGQTPLPFDKWYELEKVNEKINA